MKVPGDIFPLEAPPPEEPKERKKRMPRKKKSDFPTVQEALTAPLPAPAPIEVPIISKTEAVKRVLADGITLPIQASDEIRRRFGIEVNPSYVSNIKSTLAAKERGDLPAKKKASSPSRSSIYSPIKGGMLPPGDIEEMLEDLEKVKELKEKYGEEYLARMLRTLE